MKFKNAWAECEQHGAIMPTIKNKKDQEDLITFLLDSKLHNMRFFWLDGERNDPEMEKNGKEHPKKNVKKNVFFFCTKLMLMLMLMIWRHFLRIAFY